MPGDGNNAKAQDDGKHYGQNARTGLDCFKRLGRHFLPPCRRTRRLVKYIPSGRSPGSRVDASASLPNAKWHKWRCDRRSPLTVAGAALELPKLMDAPNSLLIGCRIDRRDQTNPSNRDYRRRAMGILRLFIITPMFFEQIDIHDPAMIGACLRTRLDNLPSDVV